MNYIFAGGNFFNYLSRENINPAAVAAGFILMLYICVNLRPDIRLYSGEPDPNTLFAYFLTD